MKIIIEIETENDMKYLKPIIENQKITIIDKYSEKTKKIESLFNNFSIKLPENYIFNREELHER